MFKEYAAYIGFAVVIIIVIIVIYKIYCFASRKVHRFPLRGLDHIPGVPVQLLNTIETLFKLSSRSKVVAFAKHGYTERYTIHDTEATAYHFMYGKENIHYSQMSANQLKWSLKKTGAIMLFSREQALTAALESKRMERAKTKKLSPQEYYLEDPKQFSISWTHHFDLHKKGQKYVDTWAKTLSDVTIANQEFWPTIANYGLAYNLLIVEKITENTLSDLKERMGDELPERYKELVDKGLLYGIDMDMFKILEPQKVDGVDRFTPATYTLLEQDPKTKALTPVVVWVSGHEGKDLTFYCLEKGAAHTTPGAWLYALQAAKVSITVYGVWVGHVYQWHIVTAAMQMCMYNSFSKDHLIYQLLEPISDYLIAFDNFLLLLWSAVAPPTSISSPNEFLEFTDSYAKGREFFDDDPEIQLNKKGIDSSDFTPEGEEKWAAFKIVQDELELWKITKKYITAFVNESYASDKAVQADRQLQEWIEACGDDDDGNIRGLPTMNSKINLMKVLTSYVYRITVHGASRLIPTANPALSFCANFPPCLQKTDIPKPNEPLTTKELLKYLPRTGTIGEMMNFYNTFSFSEPYDPALPLEGNNQELFFKEKNGKASPRNKQNIALIEFRNDLEEYIRTHRGDNLIHQWPRNIET